MTTKATGYQYRPGGLTYWLQDGVMSFEPIDGVEPTTIPAHIVFVDYDERGRRRTNFVAEANNMERSRELAEKLVKGFSEPKPTRDQRSELLEKLRPHLQDCNGGCPYCEQILDEYDALNGRSS